uniref:Reverse transcriptase domain-containing protein n=1 Tax=Daphnia galeata TaxID=27404 RepID=A0A8J2R967_9CRUS|nr:unnamed protein product [Daphnia galeata]
MEEVKKRTILAAKNASWERHIDTLEDDPEEEANIFLEQFSPNSTTPPTNPEKLKEIEKGIQNVEAEPLNSYFNMQELSRSLSILSDKAMGLDKTHNRMLRNLNLENRKRLLQIINLMFKEGYIGESGAILNKIAYHNIWIEGLLYKLTKANVRGRTLNWPKNFLTGRSIRTKVNNCLSEERKIYKGIPQGSVLSPLLFNVMFSDIPYPENGCEISLFADDIAIYCTTKTKEVAKRPLQCQLNRMEEWDNKWKLVF